MTQREVEVLMLVSAGLTNGEVAERLGTSPRTVTTQVERLMRKLGQRNRAGLAALAVDAQLIALPVPGGPMDLTAVSAIALERMALATGESRFRGEAVASLASALPRRPSSSAPLPHSAGTPQRMRSSMSAEVLWRSRTSPRTAASCTVGSSTWSPASISRIRRRCAPP